MRSPRLRWGNVIEAVLFLMLFAFCYAAGADDGTRATLLYEGQPQVSDTYRWPPISDRKAIRAVLGEARQQGDAAMFAVACAIRNRGSLRGVRGAHAIMEPISAELYQRASKAWYTSEYEADVTHGATHWENVEAFGRPWWVKDMTETAVIGKHVFYKKRRK